MSNNSPIQSAENKGLILSEREWKHIYGNNKYIEIEIDGYAIDILNPILVLFEDVVFNGVGKEEPIVCLDNVFYNELILSDEDGNLHRIHRNELGREAEAIIEDELYAHVLERLEDYKEEYETEFAIF